MQSETTDGLDFCTIKPALKLRMERLKVDKRTIADYLREIPYSNSEYDNAGGRGRIGALRGR
jgi:hypothetical protein